MLPLRSVITLMAVLALAGSAMAVPYACTAADVAAKKAVCLSCKTKAKCEGEGVPVSKGDCTIAGETCTVAGGLAVCKPFATTPCSCAKTSQCDAYDTDRTLVCLSGGVITGTKCPVGKTCVNGACVTGTPTTLPCTDTSFTGFVLKKPSCTSAVYCMGTTDMGPTVCASGTYFDVNDGNCLPLPPAPCAGCDTGACPDKSNCTKFDVCEGGVKVDDETCDAPTLTFDIITNECVETGGTCTANDKCTYVTPTTTAPITVSTASSVTTPKVSNVTAPSGTNSTASTVTTTASTRPTLCSATNVGKRYPFPGNCKKYWSCRLVSTGVYGYVESTCLSTLVYNPATTYCEAPANVPTCVPPS